ncbi:MAG: prolipoprotein diacylglyceryl transferase [Clostridia bacterium]|nr:prolipoprotein diacylglyceryl transferase [Clostridia bacterium]
MEHVVEFPGLGVRFTLNRVAFNLFGKDIYWYGIIICAGFILAAWYLSRHAKDYGFTQDNVFDAVLLGVPLGIICARIYYVAFSWDSYKDNLSEIFKIWHGGIAIYGGVIGAVLSVIIYGKWKHLSIPDMGDLAARGLLIGQCIGRWGNFVNAEAHGGPTDLPWRMVIDGAQGVHPTFFYESAWNFIGFFVLHFWAKKRRFSGEIFLGYLAWYGFGRMCIEGMRTDSLYIGSTGLRVSQLLAAVTFLIALALIVRGRRAHPVFAVPVTVAVPQESGETVAATSAAQPENTTPTTHNDNEEEHT